MPPRDPNAPEADKLPTAADEPSAAEPPVLTTDPAVPVEGEPAPTYSPEQIQRAQLMQTVGGGASWFFWISILTVVNAFLALGNSPIGFAVGFTISEIVSYFANESQAPFVGVGFAVISALFFGALGLVAGRGAVWAFALGIAILAVDTLITIRLLPDSIFSLGIHLWAIYSMFSGFNAARRVKRLPQAG